MAVMLRLVAALAVVAGAVAQFTYVNAPPPANIGPYIIPGCPLPPLCLTAGPLDSTDTPTEQNAAFSNEYNNPPMFHDETFDPTDCFTACSETCGCSAVTTYGSNCYLKTSNATVPSDNQRISYTFGPCTVAPSPPPTGGSGRAICPLLCALPSEPATDASPIYNLLYPDNSQVIYSTETGSCASQCGNGYTLTDACCTAVTQIGTACFPKGGPVGEYTNVTTYSTGNYTEVNITTFVPCPSPPPPLAPPPPTVSRSGGVCPQLCPGPVMENVDTSSAFNLYVNGVQVIGNDDIESCASQCGNNYTLSNNCCTAVTTFGSSCYFKGNNTTPFVATPVPFFNSTGRTSVLFSPC